MPGARRFTELCAPRMARLWLGLRSPPPLTVGGRGGIHLDQSRAARTGHALDIADAVAHVFGGRLARPPDPDPGPWWWRLPRRLGDALRSRLQS